MDAGLLSFAGATLLLTVTPGADTALVTRAALAGGRPAGLAATLGVSGGLLGHAALSALGLSALLAHSAAAYDAVRLLGAAYLLFLGVRALLDARKEGHPSEPDHQPRARLSPFAAFSQGLLTNLLNPKVALFYLTFLPGFIRPEDDVLARSLLLASTHFAWGVLWLGTLVLVMGRFRAALARPAVRAFLTRLTGGVLIAFGVRVALAR